LHDRHDPAESEFSEPGPAALAGAIREHAAVADHTDQRNRGARLRHPARPGRLLRVCDRGRSLGENPAGQSGANGGWAGLDRRGAPTGPAGGRRWPVQTAGRFPRPIGRAGQSRRRRSRRGRSEPVNVSEPFIHRPVATSLLMVGVVLMGLLGYYLLPISALPPVDFPTIQVVAQYPGASPDVMASSVTTPLERQFGQISGLSQMTSI